MAEYIGYFYAEDLSMTPAQRQILVDQLKSWGTRPTSPYPNLRNHWRVRPDSKAVIFEGAMDDTLMTAAAMKTRLVSIYGVAAANITYATAQTAYGPVVTYSYLGTPAVRFGVFGGTSATWAQSWAQVLAYLAANLVAWEAAL